MTLLVGKGCLCGGSVLRLLVALAVTTAFWTGSVKASIMLCNNTQNQIALAGALQHSLWMFGDIHRVRAWATIAPYRCETLIAEQASERVTFGIAVLPRNSGGSIRFLDRRSTLVLNSERGSEGVIVTNRPVYFCLTNANVNQRRQTLTSNARCEKPTFLAELGFSVMTLGGAHKKHAVVHLYEDKTNRSRSGFTLCNDRNCMD